MAGDTIDAEYEVVSGPLRHGDPHPGCPGWTYAGVDAYGWPLWRKAPRFNRWQLLAMICAAFLLFQACVYMVAESLGHH